jgi:hypothetical protein
MYKQVWLGEVDDWYSPILMSCWRLVEWLGLPPSTVLVGTTLVVVIALLTIYRLALSRSWGIIATAATLLFPPVYGLLGWVGRDVWFLALLLVVAAALGWASVLPRHRTTLLVVALVAAWFAADARQNGLPVLAVVGGIAAWLTLGPRARRWLWVAAAAILATVVGLGAQRLAHTVTVQRDVAIEQALYYQDLLAISLRLQESQVPRELLDPDRLDDVRRLWVPAQIGAVLFRDDPPVDYRPYGGHEPRTELLRDAWIDTITEHPFDYAAERLDLYRRLLGIGDEVPGAWYAESDRIDQRSSEFQQRFTGLNDARRAYIELFESGAPGLGGPLHGAWIYLLLGLVGAAAIVVTSARLRVLGASLLALQVSLQLVLVIAAPLLEYRFELFQVVLGIVAVVIGARVWFEARRRDAITPVVAPPGAASGAEQRRPASSDARP